MKELTHASWFSGAGGTDIGLERAGWTTVSFSEVEPYPCAVLTERWPGVPNLGDITAEPEPPHATLWSGGFPCQDLSVAGKRAGMGTVGARTRSGLAYAFLDLVEQHHPEAILLENVPGLLSSNAGRDFGALLGALGQLRYGWAYRILDAQWFGVPQRRRRVFILALDLERHPDPNSAGAVLAVGTSCERDHPAERTTWASAPDRFADGIGGAGVLPQAVNAKWFKQSSGPAGDEHHHLVIGPPPDAPRGGEASGLAGGLDDRAGVAFVNGKRARSVEDDEGWRADEVTPTLNQFDTGDTRATVLVSPTVNSNKTGGWRFDPDQAEGLALGGSTEDDPMNPPGLDSNRYRAIGNGVAAPCAEWIGRRLAEYLHAQP
jgi:DNA (cytosine-5)-methyltransferase 1